MADWCRFALSLWVPVNSLPFSAGCCSLLQIFYKDKRLVFEMTQHSRRWTLAVGSIQADTWYFLELSWDVHSGFQVFVDRQLVDELAYADAKTISARRNTKGRFLVGFADNADIGVPVVEGDFIIDEVELWFRDRSTLLAFDYIVRGNSS